MRTALVEDPLLVASRQVLAAGEGPLVLAVSGGCDSMVLLSAIRRLAPDRIAAVATFDHGTGAAAREACELVRAECARMGVPVESGAAQLVGAGEASWRRARWEFLRRVASARGARVATAHSLDDHVETVLMRVLRGSGARGLAGLLASGEVVRPLVTTGRGAIRAFAASTGVPYVEDPSNASRQFLRNRIRLDLLPAMREVQPSIDVELVKLSVRAAEVRAGLEAEAARVSEVMPWGGVAVARGVVAGYPRTSLAALWPAIAGRAGVALDRRGTERVVAFTTVDGAVGHRVQVSGGWELHRTADRFELRRVAPATSGEVELDGSGPVRFDVWQLRPAPAKTSDPWSASLPLGSRVVVRRWQPGDRMVAAGAMGPRRVKRFLSDARIAAPYRARWPVVESDGVVVWIPGVRRSDAATDRPGRPAVSYQCEFDDRG